MSDRSPPKFRPMTQEERESDFIFRTAMIGAWLFGCLMTISGSIKYDDFFITVMYIVSGVFAVAVSWTWQGLRHNLTENDHTDDKPTEDA